MNYTIVREDGVVIVDGRVFNEIDMSSTPENLHAAQWNGVDGVEELVDGVDTTYSEEGKYQVILDQWQAMADEEDRPRTKDEARVIRFGDIEDLNRTTNLEDFLYNGNVYVSDKDSIQAVQNQCLTMTGADPIPTPNGQWVTNDVEGDGVTPIMVSFTVDEFMTFATTFFMRSSDNYGVSTTHKGNINTLYLDIDKTSQDILDYDATTGWL